MNTLTDIVRETTRVTSGKPASPHERDSAQRAVLLLAIELKREQQRAALRSYFDWCNTILSQAARPFTDEWWNACTHRETEKTLEEWMVGVVIGKIIGDTVVVDLQGRHISVMSCFTANCMRVYSLGYSFTLTCNKEKGEVVIETLHRRK